MRRRKSGLELCGRWLEPAILLLYVCLLYKLVTLGAATAMIMGLALIPLNRHPWPVRWLTPALAIACTAMATITALRVGIDEGISRTIQFMLVVSAAAAAAKYIMVIDEQRRRHFVKIFALLNGIVLVHLVLFHLLNGHIVTWKYLYDTKFVLSMIVVLCFFYEDDLRARSASLWYLALLGILIIIVMSGERKAYLLLVAAFLLSRETLRGKLLTCGLALVAASVFAGLQPDSYVVHQLSSAQDYSSVSNRYFLSQTNIAAHSDEIRAFVNRNASRLFHEHPITGMGATGYSAWAQKTYGSLTQSHGFSMNVHGEINRVPAEGGVLGAAIALAFLASFAATCLRLFLKRAGKTTGSLDARQRAPAYILMMLIFYLSSEAMDTTMLLLILLSGFLAGSIAKQGSHGPLLRQDRTRRQRTRSMLAK